MPTEKNKNKRLSCCCDSRSYWITTTVLRDFYFNAIHCDRSVSTCE